jgi:acetate kinase
MKILIINAGSSSLKYQLIDMTDESVVSKGIVERIGIEGANLSHKFGASGAFTLKTPIKDHTAAMGVVLDALVHKEHGVISAISEISAVGHRVLHGGDKFTASCIIDDAVIQAIVDCIPLGPLHNPANLMGIKACQAVMPETPQIAVFDTAFHQTMPKKAYLYGVPMDYYKKYGIRRYGFHGTSHRYVSARAQKLLGLGPDSKVIVCHLGNGSSLSACVGGKCVDTSMGLTPLEGVLMGTRSGSIDPAIVETIAANEGISVGETVSILNKKSGLLGISGVSSDMRDVNKAADAGNENAKIALEMWAYGIRKYIGAYAAAMGGLDALVFTAGIGENDARSRGWVCEGLEYLGVELDKEVNLATRGIEGMVSKPGGKVQVWVIPTNEEIAIARDTLELASAL